MQQNRNYIISNHIKHSTKELVQIVLKKNQEEANMKENFYNYIEMLKKE